MSAATARSYEHFDEPVPPPEQVVAPARPRRRATRPEPAADRAAPERGTRNGVAGEAARKPARPDPPVEPPPAPVTAPRAPFVMLVLVLVAAGIVGLLVLNTKINENSFQLQGMRDRQAALDTREQQLESALEDKESPGNLAAAAKRLGLVPAGTPAFLHLPDGRVLGVPQPGGARNRSGR